ncbi:MAG: beta-ketoacyl-[acyl-carrier-protein] synthase II, partial [Proteobacteria bacterium]|nr:beta-ketoacyl-[acyl-carrier-protein] synthase II [Pseudomonadota bacterium]
DEVEAALLGERFPPRVRASSTKGYTGHTLGAAGGLEAAFALMAIERGLIPGNLGCTQPEAACARQLALRSERREVRVALSNSFGFGGNNACLAFARADFE